MEVCNKMWQRLLWQKHKNKLFEQKLIQKQLLNTQQHSGTWGQRCKPIQTVHYDNLKKLPFLSPKYWCKKLPLPYEYPNMKYLLALRSCSYKPHVTQSHTTIWSSNNNYKFLQVYHCIVIIKEIEIHTFNISSCAMLPRNFLLWEKATRPSKNIGQKTWYSDQQPVIQHKDSQD